MNWKNFDRLGRRNRKQAVCCGFALLWSVTAAAQNSVVTLHAFAGGTDGANPQAGLLLGTDSLLYSTTPAGGAASAGIAYSLIANGTNSTENVLTGYSHGGDPTAPAGGFIQGQTGLFYGVAPTGGAAGNGAVYDMNPVGNVLVLYSFTGLGTDGATPQGTPVQGSGGSLFGTTSAGGGTAGKGTVYTVARTGAETSLYQFSGGADGGAPLAGLVRGFNGDFYGTTSSGGAAGFGTIFQITPSGTLTTLFSFPGGQRGATSLAPMIIGSDGALYGTVSAGGTFSDGGVFRLVLPPPSGGQAVYTLLHSFTGTDGSAPKAGLYQASDGNYYGTTSTGGASNFGTVFMMTSSGTLTSLYSFGNGTDGSTPLGGLVEDTSGNLYGTTSAGGANSLGTVYELVLATPLPSPNVTTEINVTATGKTYQNITNRLAPAGIFSFTATFCNNQANPLSDLYSITTTLSNNNNLLNATIDSTSRTQPGGPGSELVFPHTGPYSSGSLTTGNCVPVRYNIGLQSVTPFTFFVDVIGNN